MGPPGVGKTSLGRSIARALGRKFHRISLGGMRDEAEIRGHRRTYIGALPGQIIQGLRRAESKNPVFMLDEIDKLGMDFRGDPASALLEVLDPEQNATFRDHYLDVPFDLSQVLFITTANMLDTVPPALRDRMEIIELAGYTEEEKVAHRAASTWCPSRRASTACAEGEHIALDRRGAAAARPRLHAGGRAAEPRARDRRASAARWPSGGWRARPTPVEVTPSAGGRAPRRPQFVLEELEERTRVPGVAVGLAWTPAGGDILFIEATRMKGSKTLTLTGQLGDVMKESAQAALSWVRAHATELGHPLRLLGDAPTSTSTCPPAPSPRTGRRPASRWSTALVSLLTQRPVRPDLAMTGEITLSGRVLPVGGIKEKVLAAQRAGHHAR